MVYANSIQAGNGTPYGTGKEEAAGILAEATAAVGGSFVDVLLPEVAARPLRAYMDPTRRVFLSARAREAAAPVETAAPVS